MSDVIKNTNKQVIAKTALKRLRSGTALYKEELENVLRALGIEYDVPNEDTAKGILISLITNVYGCDARSLTLFMSFGLIQDYSFLSITERRIRFAEYCGPGTTTEAVRKREERLLQVFVETLQKRIKREGEILISDAEAKANSINLLHIEDYGAGRLALPMMNG